MSSSLCDLPLCDIQINDPNQPEENVYVFPLAFSNDTPIVFFSKQIYLIHLKQDNCFLHIKERNDLKCFNELHRHLLETLYECHENWFEHKFERSKYNSMFKDYLFPNIEENAVNIQCNVGEEVISKLGENTNMEVYPTFKLNSIVFNNIHFQIDLELIDCVPVVVNSNSTENHDNKEPSKELSIDMEDDDEEQVEEINPFKNKTTFQAYLKDNELRSKKVFKATIENLDKDIKKEFDGIKKTQDYVNKFFSLKIIPKKE